MWSRKRLPELLHAWNVCSHTQAATIAWDVKTEYWRFLETSKKVGTSLQNLAKYGLPSGSGKKDNQIRRGGNEKKSTHSISVNPNQNANAKADP